MAEYDREIVNLAQEILGIRKPKASPPLPELEVLPANLQLPPSEQQAPPPEFEASPKGQAIEIDTGPNVYEAPAVRERPQAPVVTVERHSGRTDQPKLKEIKTAAELAQMIEADLARHRHCPKQGFQVTVYGATLWRAMLTIKPAAGPVRNPQEWRDLTEQLADRLRSQYDLAWR